jgi:hypothetical protein
MERSLTAPLLGSPEAPMTDVQKLRILIADPAGASQQFSDSDLQFMLDLNDGSLYLAAAIACDTLASKVGSSLQEVRIGDFMDSSGRNQVAALQAQAESWRTLEYETPAFAIAEENLSNFNELNIIRNYILRTEP